MEPPCGSSKRRRAITCCRHFRQYQRAAHARRRARSASVHGISRLSADIKDVAVQSDPGLVWAYAPDGRTTPGSSDESGPPEAVLTEEDLRQHLRSMTTTVQSAQIPRVGGTQPASVRFQHWPSIVAPTQYPLYLATPGLKLVTKSRNEIGHRFELNRPAFRTTWRWNQLENLIPCAHCTTSLCMVECAHMQPLKSASPCVRVDRSVSAGR